MSILSRPYFHDEEAAFSFLEAILWIDGPVCAHCGCTGRITKVKANAAKRIRVGLYRCGDCKKQFRVTVGTVFEHIRLPLHKCLQATHLLCSSKKGVSAHQISRILEVQYKTAWFLCHRIREAMRSGDLSPLGGLGSVVEVDETYIGKIEGAPPSAHLGRVKRLRNTVVTLVERGGSARSFHVDAASLANIKAITDANIDRETALMTDEVYRRVGKDFASHDHVTHSKDEYVRGNVHTNTVEGFYSVFKRGMKGVYQHCGEKHLHRYLAEFDFRYSNRSAVGVEDQERARIAVKGIVGRRLTYGGTNCQN